MKEAQTQTQKTTGLHVADRFNSTRFTNCCGLAVTPKKDLKCPGCGAVIRELSKELMS